MKILLIFLVSLAAAVLLAYLDFSASTGVLPTLYNIIGIVFAIGMGLIVSFSISGVENKDYILHIRNNINQIRQKFLILFFLCTMLFICKDCVPGTRLAESIDISVFVSDFILCFFILSIFYFIHNFIRIQKLHYDIFDRLLEEKNQRKQPMSKS